jgi:hypothetical protein
MSFLIHATHQQVAARAYNSMWIVDCAYCPNAEQVQRFQPGVMCGYCGSNMAILWPAEAMVHSIERLLLMRPLPLNRNWRPGETLHDLMRENAEHGVFDPLKQMAELAGPGVTLLNVTDETIRTDRLPVTRQREFKAVEA